MARKQERETQLAEWVHADGIEYGDGHKRDPRVDDDAGAGTGERSGGQCRRHIDTEADRQRE